MVSSPNWTPTAAHNHVRHAESILTTNSQQAGSGQHRGERRTAWDATQFPGRCRAGVAVRGKIHGGKCKVKTEALSDILEVQ